MKLNLFQRIARTARKAVETIISTFKETEEPEIVSLEQGYNPTGDDSEEARLAQMKRKYLDLFTEAHNKYTDIQYLGLEEISRAYQNAGYDFYIDDIDSMEELFREVARAQVFVSDPTSNPDVAKQIIEEMDIDLYKGRGYKDPDMQEFWHFVNMAKENTEIAGAVALKQYSGAFEYAYKVYVDTRDPLAVKNAIVDYIKTEYENHNFSDRQEGVEMGENSNPYNFGEERLF
jgi:hypothetical protein